MFKKRPSPSSSTFFDTIPIPVAIPAAFHKTASLASDKNQARPKTAIIFCEASFGEANGQTANEFIRNSGKFEILSIIDSEKAGRDAGEVLNAQSNGIPILGNLKEALADADHLPGYFIFGIARASGQHSPAEKEIILEAIDHGMTIVNGLQEFSDHHSRTVAGNESALSLS